MIRTTKVKPIVPSDHEVADMLPFRRSVEPLVHPSLMSERWSSDLSGQLEIAEPLIERRQTNKLLVAFHRIAAEDSVGPCWF